MRFHPFETGFNRWKEWEGWEGKNAYQSNYSKNTENVSNTKFEFDRIESITFCIEVDGMEVKRRFIEYQFDHVANAFRHLASPIQHFNEKQQKKRVCVVCIMYYL